ncbi:MAG: hypothetical protein ACRC0G_07700 [Fusobacteriaceae bacterium]
MENHSNNNNNYKKKNRIKNLFSTGTDELSLDPNTYKDEKKEEIVLAKVQAEPPVYKKENTYKQKDNRRDSEGGGNAPVYSKEDKKMEKETRLGLPLSTVYVANSVHLIKEVKAVLRERMPDFEATIGSLELVPYEYEVRTDNIPRKISSAKLIFKCKFAGSIYSSKRPQESSDEMGDPAFAAMVNRYSGKSNNKQDLPGDLKSLGKGLLFDDGIDIIKYKKFIDKDGNVWSDLVVMETSLDAIIVALLGLPNNEYTGYVSDCVRAKELELKLMNEQRRNGVKTGNSPIHVIRMTVDNNRVLQETLRYFKKNNNNNKNGHNNKPNKFRNAEDQFFSSNR